MASKETEKQDELMQMVVGRFITQEVDAKTWNNYFEKLDRAWFLNLGLKFVANEKLCQLIIERIWKIYQELLILLNPMQYDSVHLLPCIQLIEAILNNLKLFNLNWAEPGHLLQLFRFYYKNEKYFVEKSVKMEMILEWIANGECSLSTILVSMDYCTIMKLYMSQNDSTLQNRCANILMESKQEYLNYKFHKTVNDYFKNFKDVTKDLAAIQDFIDIFIMMFINVLFIVIDMFPFMDCDLILTIERFILVKNIQIDQRNNLLEGFDKVFKSIIPDGKLDILEMPNEQYKVAFCLRWLIDNVLSDDARKLKIIPPIKILPNEMSARNDTANTTTVRSAFAVTSGVFYYEAHILTFGKIQIGWTTRNSKVNTNGFVCDDKSFGIGISKRQNDKHLAIGCLLDMNAQKFIFYKNGDKFKEIISHVHPKPQFYFAAASLSAHQQIYFNFGQIPFKFSPDNVQFQTFHHATGNNVEKYNLLIRQKDEWYQEYWFKQEVFEDNIIEQLFQGELQNSYNDKIHEYEKIFLNDYTIKEFDSNFDNNNRLIQSIIEVAGEKLDEDVKIFYLANFIGNLIHHTDLSSYAGTFYNLIYPYLKWKVTDENSRKHRNLCLVLLSIIQQCKHLKFIVIHPIREEVFAYLVNTLKNENSDQWTQQFAIICLENLELTEQEKDIIRNDQEIIELFMWIDKHFNPENIYKMLQSNEFQLYNYQLYFCKEYFESNCLGKSVHSVNKGDKLDFTNKSAHLKLSRNGLSPRSDWQWQSVRSECKTNVETTCVIYFEVILFTPGPMRIGWTTEHTYLHKDVVVGSDEQSIGFDGFNRCVWNNSKKCPIINVQDCWKTGDVIGCLIDVPKKQFYFFLNGQQLQYSQTDIFFSTRQPYFAAITLSQHQHCLFNFGDEKFLFPPKQFDFNSFSLKQTFNQLNITGSHLTNTNIFVNSSAQIGNIEQKYNSS